MIRFEFLLKNDFEKLSKQIFKILSDNMQKIAPTGNSYKDDYKYWNDAVGEAIKKENRNIILIYYDNNLIGFFQYYTNNTIFMMEEVQINANYQHKYGIFRELFNFIFSNLPNNIETVEAYANKQNIKSNSILIKMGLQVVGKNKSGNSFFYQGKFIDLLAWYNHTK